MSPRSQSQLESIRTESRAKILDAALHLFAEHGYHNTSISRIARKAKVSKGLIYNYFDTKEDLLSGIVSEAIERGDHILEGLESAPDGKAKLRLAIEASYRFTLENKEYTKLLTMLSLQIDQFPRIRAVVLGKYDFYIPQLEQWLHEAGVADAKGESHLLGAMMDGINLQFQVMNDPELFRKQHEALKDRYGL